MQNNICVYATIMLQYDCIFYCDFAAIVTIVIAFRAWFVVFFSTAAILLLTVTFASLLAPFLDSRSFLRDSVHFPSISEILVP
jgi:hypothetical protein